MEIEDVSLLNSGCRIVRGGDGELLDISIPETPPGGLEEAEVDAISAGGLLHLADGNYGRDVGS